MIMIEICGRIDDNVFSLASPSVVICVIFNCFEQCGLLITLCRNQINLKYYLQAIEFVQFKQRLQLSNQYLIVRLEVPNLQLRQNADKIEDEEVIS